MATTKKDVQNAFVRMVCAAQAVGIRVGSDTSTWVLQEGSPSHGRAWRLLERDDLTGGLSNVIDTDRGFIGMTAREAEAMLIGMAEAFQLVSRA